MLRIDAKRGRETWQTCVICKPTSKFDEDQIKNLLSLDVERAGEVAAEPASSFERYYLPYHSQIKLLRRLSRTILEPPTMHGRHRGIETVLPGGTRIQPVKHNA